MPAMRRSPAVYILDEPEAGVDGKQSFWCMNVLSAVKKMHPSVRPTLILVQHGLGGISTLCERTINISLINEATVPETQETLALKIDTLGWECIGLHRVLTTKMNDLNESKELLEKIKKGEGKSEEEKEKKAL
jgi:energy-coupling factor transporter ATP-binding protein EcfA2